MLVGRHQSATAVKIGNILSNTTCDITLPTGRSPQAVAAIRKWHKKHPSAFWCTNPFAIEPTTIYRNGFTHLYYCTEGRLNAITVSYRGRIGKHVRGPAGPTNSAIYVVRKFGAFRG